MYWPTSNVPSKKERNTKSTRALSTKTCPFWLFRFFRMITVLKGRRRPGVYESSAGLRIKNKCCKHCIHLIAGDSDCDGLGDRTTHVRQYFDIRSSQAWSEGRACSRGVTINDHILYCCSKCCGRRTCRGIIRSHRG